jgi:hypothetical protein
LVLSPTALAQYDSSNVTLIGRWPFGDCRTAFAFGNYVCVGNGTCMDVLDVSDPDNPFKVGYVLTESIVSDIHISGNYAYIANWSNGLRVIDLTDPQKPQEVGFYNNFDGQCWAVSVYGNFAYVGNDTLGMRILDISTPSSPALVGTFNPSGNMQIEHIQVIDSLAYVASSSGLYIVDISNPASPVQLSFTPGNGSWGIYVENNIAYLPEFWNGLHMIDVSDPYFPIDEGYFSTPGSASYFEVSGNYGFIVQGSLGIHVVDLSNPISPDSVIILDTEDSYAFNIQGDYLYLGASSVGFKIIDISNPTSPYERGFYQTGGYLNDVVASDNIIYSTQYQRGVSIIDISDLANPNEITVFDMDNARFLHFEDDYLYVIDGSDLRILDISDPASPQQVYYYTSPGFFNGIFVDNNYAYIAGGLPNLTILDVSNPSSPIFVSEFSNIVGWSYDVFVTGNYAYLNNAMNGLRIINISDPYSPWEEGYFENVDNIFAVYVSGYYAYLTDRYENLLRIVDISNASTPFQVSSIDVQEARDVHVDSVYAYVVGSWSGLRIIDISDPHSPFEVGYFDTKGYAREVYFDGYVYVADGGGGLYVLQNDLITNVSNETVSPITFSLSQNYPNPFNPATVIKYQIGELSFVTLKVYDVLGNEITTLVDEEKPLGNYEVEFNANNHSSGVYFYQLKAGSFIETKKMILVR